MGETLPIVIVSAGLLLAACSGGVAPPQTQAAEEELAEEGADFTGRVLTPIRDLREERFTRSVPEAQVVVLEGPLSGSAFITDTEGRYRIPNLVGDEVRVRVEKEGFLAKEVTVYRYEPTFPPGDNRYEKHPRSMDDVQTTPGNILIGLPWPKEIKFVQEGNRGFIHTFGKVIEVESDLLLVNGEWPPEGEGCGAHSWGVITVKDLEDLGCFIHEIAHSHQAASTWFHLDTTYEVHWEETPEGEAYRLAREKDLAEHGRWGWFDTDSNLRDTIYENGAEALVEWIGVRDPDEFRRNCPNRAAWADEWFTRRIE